jgi:hypothetical protein
MNNLRRERRKLGGNVNSQSRIVANMNKLPKVIGFIAFLAMSAGAVLAQSPSKGAWKASGEVVSASKTTINGFSAISGATVFNNNRIMTGKDGGAIINLGRLGRIELGAETDMTLRISEGSIGGELRSNQMVVSARAGIAIAVNTAEGVVTTDGREAAVLTIYMDGKRPRVITHMGSASVVTTGGNNLEKRKELSQVSRSVPIMRTGVTAGVVSVATLRHIGGQAPAVRPSPTTFTSLFKAGVNYTVGPKVNGTHQGPGADESFETSITCHDSDQKTCRKKSNYKPE